MADFLHSYTPAYYMAGAVVLAGACIPFMLLCTNKKRETWRDPWVTMYDANTEEIADAPDWRRSVVYMIENKVAA